jgi:hypothetical protein
VRIWDATVPPRQGLRVTNWFYADALLDWYRLEAFEPQFWKLLKPYVEDISAHGQDTLYVPMLTPPLDGVKRPTQLLSIKRTGSAKGRKYRFDWRDVKRYVELAKRAGIRHFEWTHLFTQWGVKNAIRVYEGQGRDEKLLWKPATGATSPIYRGFLSELLPELEQFLSAEKIDSRSFFHLSDEPHGEEHAANYRKARAVLAQIAPWMKVMDALSELRQGPEALTDMPVPSISVTKSFADAGIPCWTYFCCGPRGRYLNRLMDTPLAKIRMSGWLFRRSGLPPLGVQLLAREPDPHAHRSLLRVFRSPVARMGLRRHIPGLPRTGGPGGLHPLGGVRGEPGRLRAARGSGHPARRPDAFGHSGLRPLPQGRSVVGGCTTLGTRAARVAIAPRPELPKAG